MPYFHKLLVLWLRGAAYKMSDTWCPIPWNFQAVRSNGDLRVCCQANITKDRGVLRKADGTPYNAARDDMAESRNSDLMRAVRQNMMEGKWSNECGRCRSEESSGMISRRLYEQDRWALRRPDVVQHTRNDGSIDTNALPVTYYDLRFGNLCNLACRMCGPQDSTGWYEDYQKLENRDWFMDTHGREQMTKQNGKWSSPSYGWHDNDQFWTQIESNAGNVQHVYMAGGEPLLIERHYEFLQRCIDNGAAANMIVEYNTNMTSISKRALDLWTQFKQIEIGASIDGYGKVFEYQRYPASWDKVWRNIQKVDAASDNIRAWLAYTVTAYNVLHMPDFMRWKLETSGLKKFNNSATQPIITYHMAHLPHELNVRVLPKMVKLMVMQKFDELVYWLRSENYDDYIVKSAEDIGHSVCGYMNVCHTYRKDWHTFKMFTDNLDQIRGQSVLDILPELEPWML